MKTHAYNHQVDQQQRSIDRLTRQINKLERHEKPDRRKIRELREEWGEQWRKLEESAPLIRQVEEQNRRERDELLRKRRGWFGPEDKPLFARQRARLLAARLITGVPNSRLRRKGDITCAEDLLEFLFQRKHAWKLDELRAEASRKSIPWSNVQYAKTKLALRSERTPDGWQWVLPLDAEVSLVEVRSIEPPLLLKAEARSISEPDDGVGEPGNPVRASHGEDAER